MRTTIGTVLCGAILTVGCSSGGGGDDAAPTTSESPCALIARLDAIANGFASIDVKDPEAYAREFDSAIGEYVATLRRLREVAPADLHDDLEKVESDVQQTRFDDALVDRAAVDTYAARECGRTATTGGGSTATLLPNVTTTTVVTSG